jgi:hypothetical protein
LLNLNSWSVSPLVLLVHHARFRGRAGAGYRFENGLRVQLDVLNLFNANTNQIEDYYLSRLPEKPIDGVADRHIRPAEPLAVRSMALFGRDAKSDLSRQCAAKRTSETATSRPVPRK